MSMKIERCVYLELSFGQKWYLPAKQSIGKILGELCDARPALTSTHKGHIDKILASDWDHRFNIPPHLYFSEADRFDAKDCGCIRCRLETQDFSDTDCLVLFINAHMIDDDFIMSADGISIPIHVIAHALGDCCPTLQGKTKLVLVRRLSETLTGAAGAFLCNYCSKPLSEFTDDFICTCGKSVCNNCVSDHLMRNMRVVHELQPVNQATAMQLGVNVREVHGLPNDTVLLKSKFGCAKIEIVLWSRVSEY